MAVADPDWYDSMWLTAYLAAKDIVRRVAPGRLDEFVHAFDRLRTPPGFCARHLPDLVEPARLAELRAAVRSIPQDKYELGEIALFGRLMVHNLPQFTALQHEFVDRVSAWAGEEVEPGYNFLSLYTRAGVCRPHLDSPESKWTLDLCLNQSAPWPIHFSQTVPWPDQPAGRMDPAAGAGRHGDTLRYRSVAMEPGDAILFSGSSQWHYRDPLPQDGNRHFCDLLFLHFIPRGMGELVRPPNWARLFDIPEFAECAAIANA